MLTGISRDLFALAANGNADACAPQQILGPADHRTIAVSVKPTRAGILPASLAVSAQPGGTATADVSAVATSGGPLLSAGLVHTCAVVNGGVQCWGDDEFGQLGNNSTLYVFALPVQAVGLTSGVQSIVAGDYHTCVLLGGGVKCWGIDENGQLGDGLFGSGSVGNRDVPVQVLKLRSGVQAISGSNVPVAVSAWAQ